MKIKKINEIIDDNDDIIGADDMTRNGSDLESAANNTTDNNVSIGQQPFRYDMLGRFGFNLLPFMEGVESDADEMLSEFYDVINESNKQILNKYYKNPKSIKSDYRKSIDPNGNYDVLHEMNINTMSKIFEFIKNKRGNIDEGKVSEDKIFDKLIKQLKDKKDNENEILDSEMKKLGDLISTLNRTDKDKLIKYID